MDDYKRYVSEIRKFETGPVKSSTDFGYCIKSIAPENLETLMNRALAELAVLPLVEVKRELPLIERLENQFLSLEADYARLFKKFGNGELDFPALKFRLWPLFIFSGPDPKVITAKFMVSFCISIVNRLNSILAFRIKLQKLLARRSFLQPMAKR